MLSSDFCAGCPKVVSSSFLLADASLVWLAQDTNTLNVMTMDVRDFSRYRLPDGRHFEIL